uniref:Uncharacterized protein n=1 Tax=Trichinella nativa TaxID=6335 RepID=A0A0V1KH08_9BILA
MPLMKVQPQLQLMAQDLKGRSLVAVKDSSVLEMPVP